MKSFFNSPKVFFAFVAVLILVGLGGLWYYQRQAVAPESGYFTIVDDQETVIWNKPVEELNVDPNAVVVFEQRITDYTERIESGIEDELVRRDVYSDLAQTYRLLGDYRGAYEAYLAALDLNPENRLTLYNLGNLLIEMDAFKSAEIAFQRGIAINPYPEQTYIRWAEARRQAGAPLEAILEVLDESLATAELPYETYRMKADLLIQAGRIEEAIQAYEGLKAISEDPAAIQRLIDQLQTS